MHAFSLFSLWQSHVNVINIWIIIIAVSGWSGQCSKFGLVLNCPWEARVFCVFAILQFTKLSLQCWFKFWAIGSNFTGNSRLASFILACLHHVFKHFSSCYIQFVVVEWLYLVAVEGLKVTETMTIQNLNHSLRNDTCSHCQKILIPMFIFSSIIHNLF